MEKKEDETMERVQYITEMREAIRENDINKVKSLVEEDREKLNLVLPTGSWLNLAVVNKSKELIDFFIEAGIDTDIKISSTQGNAINDAAAVCDSELIQYLMTKGIGMNILCDESNPIFDAINANNIDNLKFLLQLQKDLVDKEKYEEICKWATKEIEIINDTKMLEILLENKVEEKEDKQGEIIDKEKVSKLLTEAIINSCEGICKIYGKEDIYIMSVEVDKDSFTFHIYVNTEDNYKASIEENGEDDKWYYRFCENEWYIYEESQLHFKGLTELLCQYDSVNVEEIYTLFVEIMGKMVGENIFEKYFKEDMLFMVNAYEIWNQDEIIEAVKRMNFNKDIDDYIDNIEEFC